ncbi:enoyl-CoA hydratase [Aliamphritea ceti]|uniref:enoyl-CoA hydratase n=1 Tax=Aliamphritea ceti TaxID=1524258 RepID=UPI0021C3A9E8|nr:enoyl-CoA hydratase [Aliamphritea ceti]
MEQSLVTLDRQDALVILRLNRPQAYNSLSLQLLEALQAALIELADDESISVLVIAGTGRGFCSGHDLKEMRNAEDASLHQRIFSTCSAVMQQIIAMPMPVIAQVHGIATAAGCQLVASCDLAVAADTSRFATPGVNIGLFCSTPMVALSRAVQPKHAMEMLLLGDMISAQRAAEIGLINWCVPAADLESYTLEVANKIAAHSRATVRLGKQGFYQQLNQNVEDAYDNCSQRMVNNMQLEDCVEGIDAFVNKRHPEWQHR